jgi:hypothetical protein
VEGNLRRFGDSHAKVVVVNFDGVSSRSALPAFPRSGVRFALTLLVGKARLLGIGFARLDEVLFD